MVIPRAFIRDQHTGTQATRMMALIMLVISISPMLAPLVGSGVLMPGSWRLLFWVLCVVGLFFDGTALPMVAAVALCAVAAMGLALLVLPRLAVSQAPALRP